jgi:single-strand DNA-binding protein
VSASLNKALLIGRLTRDPEIRYLPKGTAVAEVGLAINHTWKSNNGEKQEEVTFVDVTLWGRLAEIAEKYLSKGSSVFIEGRLHLESWTDQQSGQKRSKLKIVGESLQFLGGKPAPQGQSSRPRASANAIRPATSPSELDDSSIPF